MFLTISVLLIFVTSFVVYRLNAIGMIEKIFVILSKPNQPMERYGWMGMDIKWTPLEYLLTELRVVSRYIFLILVPLPSLMTFDYSNAYPVSRDLLNPVTTMLSLFFLAFILFICMVQSTIISSPFPME